MSLFAASSTHSSHAPHIPAPVPKSVWEDTSRALPIQVIGTAFHAGELPQSEFDTLRATHFVFPNQNNDVVAIRFRRGQDRKLYFMPVHGASGSEPIVIFRSIDKTGTYLFLTEKEFRTAGFTYLRNS